MVFKDLSPSSTIFKRRTYTFGQVETQQSPALQEATLEANLAQTQMAIAEKQELITQLASEIEQLKQLTQPTAEELSRLSNLRQAIEEKKAEVAELQKKVDELKALVAQKSKVVSDLQNRLNQIPELIKQWQYRISVAEEVVKKRNLRDSGERDKAHRAINNFNEVWKGVAEITNVDGYFWDRHTFYGKERHRSSTFAITWTVGGASYGTTSAKTWEQNEDSYIKKFRDTVIGYANTQIELLNQEANRIRNELLPKAQSELSDANTVLTNAQEDLLTAKNELSNLESTLRAEEVRINQAVNLRKSEFESAQARYEMELRLLEQLKATEQMLRLQIEAAKQAAIAEAARQNEQILSVKEKERLAVAQQILEQAEQKAAVAEAEAIVGTKEREELMQQAYTEASIAKSQAEEAARQREQAALQRAEAEANLAVLQSKISELQRKTGVTPTIAPIAEERPVPIVLLVLIGLGLMEAFSPRPR